MKLGRMVYNDKRQVPFEDELNRPIKTEDWDHLSFFFINIVSQNLGIFLTETSFD